MVWERKSTFGITKNELNIRIIVEMDKIWNPLRILRYSTQVTK